MKKILYISIPLLLIFAGGLFWWLNRPQPEPQVDTAQGEEGSTVTNNSPDPDNSFVINNNPDSSNEKDVVFGLLHDNFLLDYRIIGETFLGINSAGNIINITNGETIETNTSFGEEISFASFSYSGDYVVAVSMGDNPKWKLFDLKSDNWTDLDVSPENIEWSPFENKFVFLTEQENGSNINTLTISPEKITTKKITSLSARNLGFEWKDKDVVFIYQKTDSKNSGVSLELDLSSGIFSAPSSLVYSFRINWDHELQHGLMFAGNQNGHTGNLLLIKNGSVDTLNLLTIPNKCVFENDVFIICAIPKNIEALTVGSFPTDYESYQVFSNDAFYRININTGFIEKIFDENIKIDASRLRLGDSNLLFTNRLDGMVYGIKILPPSQN